MSAAGGIDVGGAPPVPSAGRRVAANVMAFIAAFGRRRTEHRPWHGLRRPGHSLAIGALVTIAVLAATMYLFDAWAITQQRAMPRWLLSVCEVITEFGRSGWYLIPSGVLLLLLALLASPALGRITNEVLLAIAVRLSFIFVAIGLPSLIVTVIKRVIGRARPRHFESSGVFEFAPFGWRSDFASLPSGHGTTAFAAAVALGAIFPKARPFFWIAAAAIGLTRVVLGAHYPSDVIAAAIFGTCGALLVRAWFASRRLGFVLDSDGRIRSLPGPSLRRIKTVARRLAGQ
jgi:undecaprenyl-diphosphatase